MSEPIMAYVRNTRVLGHDVLQMRIDTLCSDMWVFGSLKDITKSIRPWPYLQAFEIPNPISAADFWLPAGNFAFHLYLIETLGEPPRSDVQTSIPTED